MKIVYSKSRYSDKDIEFDVYPYVITLCRGHTQILCVDHNLIKYTQKKTSCDSLIYTRNSADFIS